MSASMPRSSQRKPESRLGRRLGFTLVEMLVVMGVIAVLGLISALAVKRVSDDVKISGATNQMMSYLGEARAEAIRKRQCVLVTFRVKQLSDSRQLTQVIAAGWSGRFRNPVSDVWNEPYYPLTNIAPLDLPVGIKVAAPRSDFDQANRFITQPELANNLSGARERGRSIGIMFGPDGTVLTRNPQAPAAGTTYASAYVDFDLVPGTTNYNQNVGTTSDGARFFVYDEYVDEPSIQYVQSLAIFSDQECRERYDTTQWRGTSTSGNETSGENLMRLQQSEFIESNASRVEFNRFTGVAQVVGR